MVRYYRHNVHASVAQQVWTVLGLKQETLACACHGSRVRHAIAL